MVQVIVADEATVHEKKLFASCSLCCFWFADEPEDVHDVRLLFHWHELLILIISEYIHDALAKVSRRKMEYLQSIVMHFKVNFRIGKSDTLKLIDDVTRLYIISFQKSSSCRNIEKKIFYRDGCSVR